MEKEKKTANVKENTRKELTEKELEKVVGGMRKGPLNAAICGQR